MIAFHLTSSMEVFGHVINCSVLNVLSMKVGSISREQQAVTLYQHRDDAHVAKDISMRLIGDVRVLHVQSPRHVPLSEVAVNSSFRRCS